MSDTEIISKWYNNNAQTEESRLVDGRLEFLITLQSILISLPKDKPLRIADIGGGTGRYAVELAKRGHKVTLIDISKSELEIASQHAKTNNVTLEAIICADASQLQNAQPKLQEASFDAILLLGPLYHLLEPQERIATLSGSAKLLKPDGIIAASFLTKFGHLRGVARTDPGRLAREWAFYEKYLEHGKYDRRQNIFSHHSHPEEIRQLFEAQKGLGLKLERLVACESFLGSQLAIGLNELGDDEYQVWLRVLLEYSKDPCALGASEHILAIGRRV
ncbi:S-adenosyl-L-methionine-dependent methyltransferase [Stipitochalara longipes BDJ]|nr:S-adenosyl-L-methionine-dependent methyltransferase [Stipitochalara longipes BDJ]